MRCKICDVITNSRPDRTGDIVCSSCSEDVREIMLDWMLELEEDDYNFGFGEKLARGRLRPGAKRKQSVTLIDTTEVED
jgi:hypothetical protein